MLQMLKVVLFVALVSMPPILCAELMACRTIPDAWIVPDNLTTSKYQENRIKALEEKVLQLQRLVLDSGRLPPHSTIDGIPKDCGEIYRSGVQTDGEYTISPDGRCPFLVYCDMTNGGWTLIQKRESGTVNFYRTWDEYATGFGDISGEHWLGLDKIHRLTQGGYQIYFDLENYDGTNEYAHYKTFTVHGPSELYRMNVDAFGYNGSIPELLSFHDNMKFSTYDRDNDVSSRDCVIVYASGGGWWFKDCYRLGLLNSVYGKQEIGGIGFWDNAKFVSIQNVRIKVKAKFDMC